MKRALAGAAMLCAPACGTGPEGPSMAERLQGHWAREATLPDGGFLRAEYVTLAVRNTTIQYSYHVSWECPPEEACPGEPPAAYGGYFEGIFEDLGDSLALKDALEPVSFRPLSDSALLFIVDSGSFALERR